MSIVIGFDASNTFSTWNAATFGRVLYVCEEKLSQIWPPIAFVPAARVAFVPMTFTGLRRSSPRKLCEKKFGSVCTCCRNHCFAWGDFGSTFSGGWLLEWQPAQFSAKTILPRFN